MNTRYRIFLYGIVLIVASALISFVSLFSQFKETARLKHYVAASAIEERLGGVFTAINDFPGSAGKDMLFLRSLSSIAIFYNEFSVAQWRRAHADLQQFIDRNTAYDEIHIHAPVCTFTVRRVSDESGDTACVSPGDMLGDTVAETHKLKDGSVYVSPLVPYTRKIEGKDSTIPAVMYGTRVSAQGSEDGIAVAVVNANYFLEEIRRLRREGEAVYLVATDGSYLAHPERGKERMEGGNANFYEDYPGAPAGILSDASARRIEANDKVFTFLRITPTASNFALYDDEDPVQDGRLWVIVAVSDHVGQGAWWLSTIFLASAGALLLIHALVVVFLRMALFPTNQVWHREARVGKHTEQRCCVSTLGEDGSQ